MVHTLTLPNRQQPHASGRLEVGALRLDLDGSRIAANAGAIAINAAVLLLLLVPVAMPPPAPEAERDPDVILVQPKVEPEPVVVPVVPAKPRMQQPPALRPPIAPPQLERPVVDSMPQDIFVPSVDPVVREDPGDTIDITPQPAASTQLQPISAPPPSYPADAIRRGLTGTVELEILVGVDGKPLEAKVVRSSGHRVLDEAARKVVLSRWRFHPAVRDGREVQALGRVPIVFTLHQ